MGFFWEWFGSFLGVFTSFWEFFGSFWESAWPHPPSCVVWVGSVGVAFYGVVWCVVWLMVGWVGGWLCVCLCVCLFV